MGASITQEKYACNTEYWDLDILENEHNEKSESQSLLPVNQVSIRNSNENVEQRQAAEEAKPIENKKYAKNVSLLCKTIDIQDPCMLIRLIIIAASAISFCYLTILNNCQALSSKHCLLFMCGCYTVVEVMC